MNNRTKLLFFFTMMVAFLVSHNNSEYVADTNTLQHHLSRSLENVYTNPNDTYSASSFVEYGHMLSGKDFSTNMEYLQRVLYVPVGLFALGFLAIFFLDWGLLFRCCCSCCKCAPDRRNEKYNYNRKCNYAWFFILCFLVLLFDQLVFLGNTEVDKGVKTTSNAIGDASDIVETLRVESYTMYTYGTEFQAQIETAKTTCQDADESLEEMEPFAETFTESMDSIYGQMKSIDKSLTKVSDDMDLYAVEYRVMGLYIVWALSIGSVLFLLLSHCCKSVVALQLAMAFAQLTFLIYIVLGVGWCLTTSLLGDLCMDPSYNLVHNLPSEDLKDIAGYYASCVGASELQTYAQESQDSIAELQRKLNESSSYCPDHTFDAMFAKLDQISSGMTDVTASLDCPPIQRIWFSVINDGLCTELYTGFFYIWGSQLITSFLLFCLVLTAAFTHQFYASRGVAPASNEEEEALQANEVVDGEDDDNEFVAEYRKKSAAHSNHGHHEVVDKNHHLPHQVQVQEADDDAFFV